jgi:tripartite-type tricarboxylate transporter receptor subunit TctC
VVHPSLPAKSVKELIAIAKAKPGELNFGSGGVGTTPHMAGELFAAMAGIKIVNVSYKGEAPALTDILGGQVPMMFSNAPAAMPHVKAGNLRGLAVTSAERVAVAPGVPTVAESGLPGYEAQTWFGLVAPAATPREIVARLNAEILRVLAHPDVKERLVGQGVTIVGSTPEQFAGHIKSEFAKWAKVVKDAGIKPE